MARSSTDPRAPKSMPWPGTTWLLVITLATLPCPAARAAAAACSVLSPAGSCRPRTPAKMMSVARPRIFGPATDRLTLVIASRTTPAIMPRSGARRPTSRRAEGPKVMAFAAGIPIAAIGPRPKPGPAGRGGGPAGRSRVGDGRLMWGPPRRRGAPAESFRGVRSCHGLHRVLGFDDLLVRRAAREQLVVGAGAGHPAVVQHDDLIGVGDRGHPLGHDDHGRLAGPRPQSRAQTGVGGHVERGERVIEQVDLRTTDQRPGDRQPLPLAAGEIGAALAHRGLEALGKGAHEVTGLSDLQRGPQFVVGRLGPAVAQVA